MGLFDKKLVDRSTLPSPSDIKKELKETKAPKKQKTITSLDEKAPKFTPSFVMSPTINMEPGYFYETGNLYLLPFVPISSNIKLDLSPWNITCMFAINNMTVQGQRVGLAFRSGFKVTNGGGYLMTHMSQREPKDFMTLVRVPEVVIFNYPNHGALAISTRLNPDVLSLIEEQ